MNTKVITAWDALCRTQASRRTKSVVPQMDKIYARIMEAADAERDYLDITDVKKNITLAIWMMIHDSLNNQGYMVEEKEGGAAKLWWDRAKAPVSSSFER